EPLFCEGGGLACLPTESTAGADNGGSSSSTAMNAFLAFLFASVPFLDLFDLHNSMAPPTRGGPYRLRRFQPEAGNERCQDQPEDEFSHKFGVWCSLPAF